MTRNKQYDYDQDGKVSEQELDRAEQHFELELRETKSEQQKRMANVSQGAMIVFTVALFFPFIPTERIEAISDVASMFYIAQAGIVSAYFGVTAWMTGSITKK